MNPLYSPTQASLTNFTGGAGVLYQSTKGIAMRKYFKFHLCVRSYFFFLVSSILFTLVSIFFYASFSYVRFIKHFVFRFLLFLLLSLYLHFSNFFTTFFLQRVIRSLLALTLVRSPPYLQAPVLLLYTLQGQCQECWL